MNLIGCPHCKGLGVVYSPLDHYYVECEDCDGKGTIEEVDKEEGMREDKDAGVV